MSQKGSFDKFCHKFESARFLRAALVESFGTLVVNSAFFCLVYKPLWSPSCLCWNFPHLRDETVGREGVWLLLSRQQREQRYFWGHKTINLPMWVATPKIFLALKLCLKKREYSPFFSYKVKLTLACFCTPWVKRSNGSKWHFLLCLWKLKALREQGGAVDRSPNGKQHINKHYKQSRKLAEFLETASMTHLQLKFLLTFLHFRAQCSCERPFRTTGCWRQSVQTSI